MLNLFVESLKGNMNVYENVYKVKIKKIDNKNVLEIIYNSLKDCEHIFLSNIKLCYLIDVDSTREYFRYEK